MKTNLKMIPLILVGLSLGQLALADAPTQTVDLGGGLHLGNGQTETIELNGWQYVKKIFVSARGSSWSDGTMQVIANGDVKGTVRVPGSDPSYVVTIEANVSSIQFTQISGGSIDISDVQAVEEFPGFPQQPPIQAPFPGGGSVGSPDHFDNNGTSGLKVVNTATDVATRAMELVDSLVGMSDYSEEGQYLLPIKKSAAELYAVARAQSSESPDVRNDLIALSGEIDTATPYIDQYLERSDAFDLATELLSLKEQINALVE